MEISTLVQAFANGLVLGSNYMLLASGFSLIYGIMRLLNFAHGELYTFSGYILVICMETIGIPYIVSCLIAVTITALAGVVIEKLFFKPFRMAHHDVSLILALGVVLLLNASGLLVFGPTDVLIRPYIRGAFEIGGIRMGWDRMVILPTAIIIMVVLWRFLEKTKTGRALRATAQDLEVIGLMGISIDRVSSLGFAIACGLAAAAGCLMIPVTYLNPFVGMDTIFKILIVVVIGGLGSIEGAIVAGLLLGMVESIGYLFIGGFASMLGFGFVIIVLLWRPTGLMGRF